MITQALIDLADQIASVRISLITFHRQKAHSGAVIECGLANTTLQQCRMRPGQHLAYNQ